MRSGAVQFGAAMGLILAGVVGATLLLLNGAPTVAADLRLDDYETSWPNHVEVQTAGADLANQMNDQALDLEVSIRKDRSTVRVVAPEETPPSDIDALIERVVSQDLQTRTDRATAEDVTSSLAAVLVDLERLETEDSADPTEVTRLADQAVLLRSALANQSVSAATARSRFVPLQPASEQAPQFPLAQWAVALILIASGGAIFGMRARTQ